MKHSPLRYPQPGQRDCSNRRVFVVDDNRDAANALESLLKLCGIEAYVAYGGAEALERVGKVRPSVVILDLNMPGPDGFEVARNLRRRFPACVLVALSARSDVESRDAARAAGFDVQLVKPADLPSLEALLSELLPDAPPAPCAPAGRDAGRGGGQSDAASGPL